MTTDAQVPANGRKLFVVLLYFVALSVGAAVSFFEIFSQFKAYDDEGYVMRSVQSYLDGHVLYDEVYTQYGPVFFLWKAGWHAFTGWPISHDMVRLTTILTWLCTALLCSLASFRITKSLPIASAVYLLTFVMLSRIISESGHPQEFCALLLAMLAYAATLATTARRKWVVFACIGALMALLLLTKVNVGLYAGLAFCGAMLSFAAPGKLRLAASCALLGVAAIFPFAFMRAHIDDFWGVNYIALATFSGLAALAVALFGDRKGYATGQHFESLTRQPRVEERRVSTISLIHVAVAAGTFFAVAAIVIVVVLKGGTSPAGFVHGVLGQHLGFANEFFHPPKFASPAVLLAFLSFVAAVGYCLCQRNFREFAQRNETVLNAVGTTARLLLVLGVVVAASFGSALNMLAFAVPWIWLAMVGSFTQDRLLENVFFRRVGALLVAFEILQGYPIAGTQLTIATFLAVAVVSLCGWDLWRQLQASKFALSSRFAWVGKGAIYASIVVAWAWLGASNYLTYKNLTPLGLPGANWVRLKEVQVAELRCVAMNLRQRCDTFFSSPGLNSFYFWTHLAPPTHVNATVWTGLLSDAQELAIVNELERHPEALLVRHLRLDSIPRKHLDGQPLVEYLRARFKTVAQVGQYVIFADKARAMTPLVEAATLMPAFTPVALSSADDRLPAAEQTSAKFQIRLSSEAHPQTAITRIVIVDSRNDRVLADSGRKSKQSLQILDANLRPLELPLPATWMEDQSVGTLYLAPNANWKPPATFANALVRVLDEHGEIIALIPLAQ